MAVEKAIASSSLGEIVDRILDKGVVVDAWVRVSLVGIEILAIEARVTVAGVDTFLKYAEAVGLTGLRQLKYCSASGWPCQSSTRAAGLPVSGRQIERNRYHGLRRR
jgi:hypothetical protein